jgi:hypothetical protein
MARQEKNDPGPNSYWHRRHLSPLEPLEKLEKPAQAAQT